MSEPEQLSLGLTHADDWFADFCKELLAEPPQDVLPDTPTQRAAAQARFERHRRYCEERRQRWLTDPYCNRFND